MKMEWFFFLLFFFLFSQEKEMKRKTFLLCNNLQAREKREREEKGKEKKHISGCRTRQTHDEAEERSLQISKHKFFSLTIGQFLFLLI